MAVPVDQMLPEQAQAILTSGLRQLDPEIAKGLLAVTGRWPLLLRLVNKILVDYARVAADVSEQGAALLARLRAGGPAVVDEILGNASRELRFGQPLERAQAIRATLMASTSLLNDDDRERFAELAVFAAAEIIPFNLAARLWRATSGLDDELQAAQVYKRVVELGLVSQATGQDGITLHDVIRDFLQAKTGKDRLAELTGMLLDAVAATLPPANLADAAPLHRVRTAWWKLNRDEMYLWDHLIEHLLVAKRPDDAEAVASDLRWVGARVEGFGPAAAAADLSLTGTERAKRLEAVLARTAHLLASTELPSAVIDVLHSQVADDSDWGVQVTALRDTYRRPRLVNRWPLPDRAHPALQRVLTGHTQYVTALAVAPDGRWLASSSYDGTVRIWDVATGQQRTTLTERGAFPVTTVAVAPDGGWLVSGSNGLWVRIWDLASGKVQSSLFNHGDTHSVAVAPDGSWLAFERDQRVLLWEVTRRRRRATLTGHTGHVTALAVAPDGSWLASGSTDETVRIWDAATGQQRAVLTDRAGWVHAVAVAPDGTWLASGSDDGTVRIWDVSTGQRRATLTGHTRAVSCVVIAPDGSWLASSSYDGTVRIWDVATGQQRAAALDDPSRKAYAMAVAPDGSWLACGSDDGTVRIWDVANWQQQAVSAGHISCVREVAAAPDGSWLASVSDDGIVAIWDVATRQQRATLTGHTGWVLAVAVAPDGSWLASGSNDGTVRIWDMATRQQRAILTGHCDVTAVAVAPDGSWLASGNADATVRIWDVATGQQRSAALVGHSRWVSAVAVAPDGSWLASGGGDSTVRIWDVATGQQRSAALVGHSSPTFRDSMIGTDVLAGQCADRGV